MRHGSFLHRFKIHAALVVAVLAVGLGTETARSHGEADHQIAHLTRLLEDDSRNPVLFWQRGELYRVRENWAAAVSDFEKAARLDPQTFSADFGRGLVLLDRGYSDEALRAIDRHLDVHPNSSNALFVRAEALARTGHIDDAVRGMNRAIDSASHAPPDAYLARARWLAMASPDGIDRAIASLDEGLERMGPVVTLQLRAVELELARGMYDNAIRRLDALIPLFHRRETLLARKGEIFELAGMQMEAIVAYTEALDAIDQLSVDKRTIASVVSLDADVRDRLARLEMSFRKRAQP